MMTTKRRENQKKKKDPNAPKRGASSYMLFMKEQRQRIVAENPGAKFGEIGKLVGEAFKALSEEEKRKYEVMAEKDKERYNQEMKAYEAKKNAKTAASNSEESDDSDA